MVSMVCGEGKKGSRVAAFGVLLGLGALGLRWLERPVPPTLVIT